jgi:small subunit ribosomal protein S3
MGQKTNPISNRLGIIKGWDSNWYGGKDFSTKLVEDNKIRSYIHARLSKASISKIVIERTLKLITVTVHTARPGLIIGKLGQEVDKLKEELRKITQKDVQINIFEVKRPELDATIVANNIAHQVEGKISYRRAMKMGIMSTMRMGAEGIKVIASGRLGGAEMARSEMLKEGRIPLHTFRADIDFALDEALTKVGLIGIKVWICNGEIYGKRDLSPNIGNYSTSQQGGGFNRQARGEFRGERNDRDRNVRGDRRDRFERVDSGRDSGGRNDGGGGHDRGGRDRDRNRNNNKGYNAGKGGNRNSSGRR